LKIVSSHRSANNFYAVVDDNDNDDGVFLFIFFLFKTQQQMKKIMLVTYLENCTTACLIKKKGKNIFTTQ